MSRAKTRLLVTFLLLGATAGLATHRFVVAQLAELAQRRANLSRIETDLRDARLQLAAAQREFAELERATAQARAAAAARESAPTHLWATRVLLMRQLLEEMPAHKIPELKLLTLLDWIQVARTAELDTANRIRTAFIALRTAARRRFSDVLRPALRAFVTASGGELPNDVRQLAAHFPPGVDPALLERYEMLRAGKIGATDEYLIREKPGSDATLQVGLESVPIDSRSSLDETQLADLADTAERLSGLVDDTVIADPEKMTEFFAPLFTALPTLVEKYTPQLTEAFGTHPGELFKDAAFRFRAANPDATLSHAGQLLPYLPDQQKFLATVRVAFAELEHFLTHQEIAPDAAALAPFLEKPFNPESALRMIELKLEDRSLSMNITLTKSKHEVTTRRAPAPSP